jgi:hypothetical protein
MATPIGFRPRRIASIAATLTGLLMVLIAAAVTATVKRIKAATTRPNETQAGNDRDADNSLEYIHSDLLVGKCPANIINARPERALTGSGQIAVKMG